MKIAMIGCGAAGSVFAAYLKRGGAELYLVDKYKAKPEDFKGLSEFVDKISNQCDVLIISSPEGYSRAASLAAAIEEYIGFPDLVWCNRRLKPNEYVYQLAGDYLCGKYI